MLLHRARKQVLKVKSRVWVFEHWECYSYCIPISSVYHLEIKRMAYALLRLHLTLNDMQTFCVLGTSKMCLFSYFLWFLFDSGTTLLWTPRSSLWLWGLSPKRLNPNWRSNWLTWQMWAPTFLFTLNTWCMNPWVTLRVSFGIKESLCVCWLNIVEHT